MNIISNVITIETARLMVNSKLVRTRTKVNTKAKLTYHSFTVSCSQVLETEKQFLELRCMVLTSNFPAPDD